LRVTAGPVLTENESRPVPHLPAFSQNDFACSPTSPRSHENQFRPLPHLAGPDAPASTREWARPFLWRIEGTPPSYLFGTVHLFPRPVGR